MNDFTAPILGSSAGVSVDAEHDFPVGQGDDDYCGNVCITCDHAFRGHKQAMRCRKCHENAQKWWNSMTLEDQQAHHSANMEAAARFFAENDMHERV